MAKGNPVIKPEAAAAAVGEDKTLHTPELPPGLRSELPPNKPDAPVRPPWMLPSYQPPGVPLTDPVEELVSAIDSRTIEVVNTYLWMIMTGATLSSEDLLNMFGRERLREAVKSFYDRLLEHQLDLQRIRPTKGRPPSNEKLMGADINQAMKNAGSTAEQIRQFWTELAALRAKPTDPPSTIRKRRSRARKA